MELEKTIFEDYCEKGVFAIVGANVYEPFPTLPEWQNDEPYLYFHGKKFALEHQGSVTEAFDLPTLADHWETIRAQKEQQSSHQTLPGESLREREDTDTLHMLDTIIQDVIPKYANPRHTVSQKKREKASWSYLSAKTAFPDNLIVCAGEGFLLTPYSGTQEPDAQEYVYCGGMFTIGEKIELAAQHQIHRMALEADINAYIREGDEENGFRSHPRHLEAAREGSYFDTSANAGITRIDGDYYVYAALEPFDLYEAQDGRYYHFPAVRVGTRVRTGAEGPKWEHPLVIDAYTHPSLPSFDHPMQRICLGPDNERLASMQTDLGRGRDTFAHQVPMVLYSAARTLESGYRTDLGVTAFHPYHTIGNTQSYYQSRVTHSPSRVTNV